MLKQTLQEDMKAALKSGEKRRLGAVRLILAAVKQREVDERKELDDSDVLATLEKMLKQRRESLSQYEKAGRSDLAEQESFEIDVIRGYMPEPISESELATIVDEVIASVGAKSLRDMGKVMADLRARVQGRADMGAVGSLVKRRLSG